MPRSVHSLDVLPHSEQMRHDRSGRALDEFVALRAVNPSAAFPVGVSLAQSLRDGRNKDALATCLRHLGSMASEFGEHQQGLKYACEAASIFEETGNEEALVGALAVQGTALSAQGMYQLALSQMRRAENIAKDLGLQSDVAKLSSGIGSIYRATGDTAAAATVYRNGMRAAARLSLNRTYCALLNNLAMNFLESAAPQRAIILAQRCLKLLGAGDQPSPQRAYVLHTLASAYKATGDNVRAKLHFEAALPPARLHGLVTIERKCEFEIAKLLRDIGDDAGAKIRFDAAYALAVRANDARMALEISLYRAEKVRHVANAERSFIHVALEHLKQYDGSLQRGKNAVVALENEFDAVKREAESRRSQTQTLKNKLEQAQQNVYALNIAANTDPLTGLGNRRAMIEFASTRLDSQRSRHPPFSVLMLDADNFKLINDAYGHELGDQVLAKLASALRSALRPQDAIFRLGGDEFVVVCMSRGTRAGEQLAEDCLRLAREIYLPRADALRLSVSVGVVYVPEKTSAHWRLILARADAALLRAKSKGRSRLESERLTPAFVREAAASGAESGQSADSA